MSEKTRILIDLVILFGSGFAICMGLTPLVRAIARAVGLVDRPDGRRKIHSEEIPVAGGVVVFLASAFVLVVALGQLGAWETSLFGGRAVFASLLGASAVIVAVGVIDDYRGMHGWVKLFGQLVAVGVVVFAGGVQVRHVMLFDNLVDLGVLSLPLTFFWLLGAINSLNLIDGMDGLLGSVGLILCLTIGALAFLSGHLTAACVAVTLAGALLGFLWYNFPPATIYLGDAGSMLIGLVVGTLAIQASLKGPAMVGLGVPVLLMIVPIFDTSAAIVRRKLTGRSIYTTDRGHLHHVLMNSGLSNRMVLLLVGVLCVLAGTGAVFSQWYKSEILAVGTALAIMGFLIAFKLFGHAEYLLIKQRLGAMMINVRHGNEPGRIHQIKVHLQGSADWNELWKGLTIAADALKLKTLCFDVNMPAIHEGYHARWERVQKDTTEVTGFWRGEFPLAVHGQTVGRLEVIGLRDAESVGPRLAAVAKIVEDIELAIAAIIAKKKNDETQPPRPTHNELQLERV